MNNNPKIIIDKITSLDSFSTFSLKWLKSSSETVDDLRPSRSVTGRNTRINANMANKLIIYKLIKLIIIM